MNKETKQEKEILVRKRTSAFIEKLLNHSGYDFHHDEYKQIIYGETDCKTPFQTMVKNLYDAYTYLISNAKSPLSSGILKRFIYILEEKEPKEDFVLRMTSKLFQLLDSPMLEKAIEYHMYVYDSMKWLEKSTRTMVALMFFNYILAKEDNPTISFAKQALKEYEECRSKYLEGNKTPLYNFLCEQIAQGKYQGKEFYGNLNPLSTQEICSRFLKDKEMLNERFCVKGLALYGSFSKELQRIDSDIDLFVVFSDDISYLKKIELSESLSNYYFTVFNRYVDITEISEYVGDWLIGETPTYKKIF